jgi:sec-independent protein translocase protein TatA
MPTLGVPELMVILGIAVLMFGGRKIPEVAKGLGQGLREFKQAMRDDKPDADKQASGVEKSS